MRDISESLLRGQRARTILGKNLLIKCDLSYTSVSTGLIEYSYTKTKIKQLSHTEQAFSHKAELLLEDTDKVLHGLDLEGYKAVLSYGLITRAGEEWVSTAPLWVVGQQRDSYRDKLECSLSLEGIFDRMGRHKAEATYTPDSGDTRTVKDWLYEIIMLSDSASSSTEEQTTSDSDIHNISYSIGQRLTISARRLTKLAFKLKKVGSPSGNVTFKIYSYIGTVLLASKVLGDAFNLGTSYGWEEVTFDAPVLIDEEVRIICEYLDGDGSNYVDMQYNSSSVKASEVLCHRQVATWVDMDDQDIVYRYTYSATPVTVYDRYPAYGLVFDSEDSLIDSFVVADSFRINLNDTRLQKVKELLRYTNCVARVGLGPYGFFDEKIHIFDPTTSGTTYDNQYTLVEGRDNDNFFNKRFRTRIVSPNYVAFKNHPSHDDSYSGYAKDDSADLTNMREIETHYVRATSNAQCTSLAEAFLSKKQMDAEKGSVVLPFVHFGQEIYDYVNIVDARAGDSRAGNVGFLARFYKPGQFNMQLGFGRLPVGVAPLQRVVAEALGVDTGEPGVTAERRLTAQDLVPALLELQSWIYDILLALEDKADIAAVNDILLDLYEDAYFRKLTALKAVIDDAEIVTTAQIPSEAA